jgi:type IV pilus assembly protein PilV
MLMNSSSLYSPARRRNPACSRAGGFTLIEVMVALVITAIGLLGIAKIQALAYASTGSAGIRSLVALEAAGLAASMHANRNYWSGLSPPVVTITGTTISDATLATPANCLNVQCLPATLAAFDLQTYAAALGGPTGLLPSSNPITTITCAAITPTSCTIQVAWGEHAVSVNSQSAANTAQTTSTSAGTFAPTYTLYVEP